MLGVGLARQRTYTQSVVDKTRELFGDTSVEYGMALCGALELESHIKDYRKLFTAKELLLATTVEEGTDEGASLIANAQWVLKVTELCELILDQIGSNPRPAPWFTPSK